MSAANKAHHEWLLQLARADRLPEDIFRDPVIREVLDQFQTLCANYRIAREVTDAENSAAVSEAAAVGAFAERFSMALLFGRAAPSQDHAMLAAGNLARLTQEAGKSSTSSDNKVAENRHNPRKNMSMRGTHARDGSLQNEAGVMIMRVNLYI